MLYMISFSLIGTLFAYFVGKLFGADFSDHQFMPSTGHILMFCGALVGGGVGIGYGSSLLFNGTHFYNKIYNLLLN